MFHSLDDQIKHGQGRAPAKWNRMVQCAAVLILTVVLFGGLNWGIRFLG